MTLIGPVAASRPVTPLSPSAIHRCASTGESFWEVLQQRLESEDADRSDPIPPGRTSSDEPGSSPVIAPEQSSPSALATELYGDSAGLRALATPGLSTASDTDAGATQSERASSSEGFGMEYFLDPARFDSV